MNVERIYFEDVHVEADAVIIDGSQLNAIIVVNLVIFRVFVVCRAVAHTSLMEMKVMQMEYMKVILLYQVQMEMLYLVLLTITIHGTRLWKTAMRCCGVVGNLYGPTTIYRYIQRLIHS